MPTATKAVGATTAANTAAIMNALALVTASKGSTPAAHAPAKGPAALPTARCRVALDQMAGRGTYEEFNASMPNIKALMGDVVNWSGKPRLTKVVNKTVVAALSGADERGMSTFPQALEMLSFLALCAPLVEPDRLARIAELAAQTPNAYKPIRYMVKPAAQLQKLLAGYTEARRETLLMSLWATAHEGRWWDATGGATPGRRRRHRNADEDLPQEQRDAISEQLERAFHGGRTPSPVVVGEAFANRLLTYSDAATRLMAEVRLRKQADHKELTVHIEHPDADVPVLLSFVPELLPDERAESPIVALIETLAKDLGEDLDDLSTRPEKPEEWADLFPAASREGFPMPNRMARLDKVEIPQLPGAKVTMMRHADLLQRNAQHMGNCTFGYRGRSEAGTAFIGHLAYRDGEYNFAVMQRTTAAGVVTWHPGEINSRFNRGAVPNEVRAAVTALIGTLND